jgi:3'(2'), 5'-bisphosphate nucleotidase
MDYANRYLLRIIQASVTAGEAILEVYDTDFDVQEKEDRSPLTLADQRSHEVINRSLVQTQIPVLSEEGRHIDYSQRKSWELLWIVDPLDGTKEFIKRNGEFTVNIALVHQHEPVLGVVYVPVHKRLYFGARQLGAYRLEGGYVDRLKHIGPDISPEGSGQILEETLSASVALPDQPTHNRPYTIIGSRSHGTAEVDAFIERQRQKHGDVNFISAGSSLKFCLVAEGRADVYPRLGPTMEWDTAAGQAVVESAGGRVIEFNSRQQLRYNRPELLNPFFLVDRE